LVVVTTTEPSRSVTLAALYFFIEQILDRLARGRVFGLGEFPPEVIKILTVHELCEHGPRLPERVSAQSIWAHCPTDRGHSRR
jgi:hypothetical protein